MRTGTQKSVPRQAQPGAILIRDLEALRARLLGKGEPGKLYRHVREVSRHPEMGYPLWQFLCCMVEPDSARVSQMGARLEELAARGAWRQQYNLDVHTWIAAAALGRLAIYLDWTLEHGEFSRRRCRSLGDEMLDCLEQAIRPVMRKRIPKRLKRHENIPLPNQGGALFFACAAAGAVLGYRHGRNPRARALFAEAENLFGHFVGHLRPDGYDAEGPTYQLGVQGGAMGLTCEILEQTTGASLFDQTFEPSGLDLRKWFETTCLSLISSGGMFRPIDDYGYSRPTSILPLAYAAGRSGDPRFISPVRRHSLWYAQECMWDTDDRTLSLLFWPEEEVACPAEASEVLPSTLGCLVTPGHPRTEVLATWKPCEPLPHTHAHTDPGSLVIECGGLPLVLDGRPDLVSGGALRESPYHRVLVGTNTDYFIPYRFGKSDIRDQGAAALGPHNTVVIDGVIDLPLKGPAGGELLGWEEGKEFRRMVVEVSEPYRSCFDLETFTREVVLHDDGTGVIRDRLRAATPHDFQWQMHVRSDVKQRPDGWDLSTPEGACMSFLVAGDAVPGSHALEGYPNTFEGRCVRLQLQQHGTEATFEVAFQTDDLREELAEISDGWSFRPDNGVRGFEQGWAKGGFKPRGSVDLSRTPAISGYPTAVGLEVWHERRLPVLTDDGSETVYLEMRPPMVPFRVWLDGRPVTVRHNCWSGLLPVQIELGSASDVNGKSLVLMMPDQPRTRPPGPVRLIRFRKRCPRKTRKLRGILARDYGEPSLESVPD